MKNILDQVQRRQYNFLKNYANDPDEFWIYTQDTFRK